MNKRRCLHYREYYPMDEMLKCNAGWFCDFGHMQEYGSAKAKKQKAKQEKKSHSAAKRKLKDNDRSFQVKKAQVLFNGYIRLRDYKLGCISCQRPFVGKYDAGHYRSVGAHPALRFNPYNNNGQCVHCNQHLSGNLVDYRIGLIAKIGLERVEYIEGPHAPKRYTIENLKTIQKWFKRKIRRMEREQ